MTDPDPEPPTKPRLSTAEEIRLWLSDEHKIACFIPDGTWRKVTASEYFAGPHLKDRKPRRAPVMKTGRWLPPI